MYYTLSKEQENKLLSMPETGMGYQVIEAAKTGAYIKNKYIVLNAQMAVEMDSRQGLYIHEIISNGIFKAKHSARLINFTASTFKLFNEKEFRGIVNEPKYGTVGGAIENKKEFADGEEIFVRLSAFKDDLRINKIKMCLLPGSFTTTMGDYSVCKISKSDPIERYALPSEDEIKWAFYIQPKKSDTLQRGMVQPANEKSGGGKEIYFEGGTSKNTYLKAIPY